jgi:type IV pilus assembly protein PilA
MLQNLRKRLERDEDGFTLIELMVVVLIIAILLAIAIPTFLGARDRANDRAAQSSLRNALTAAKTWYTDNQTFVGANESLTGLTTIEPSLSYAAAGTASADFKTVSVTGSASDWSAAAWSKSGKCFYIHENVTSGTKYGHGSTASTCTGTVGNGANAATFDTLVGGSTTTTAP